MTNVPAGWYPDPAGSPQQRWWNGSSWGDALQSAPQLTNPYASPYGAVQPYDPGQGHYAYSTLSAPEGTDPNTPAGWVFAISPLTGLVNVAITAALGGFSSSYLTGSSYSSATFLSYGFSFVVWLALIVVAYLDYRELQNRQVPKPFHWAFAIIPWSIVYVIGRAVVVYSRTHRGLAPLFVWIGAGALNLLVSIVLGVALSASIMNGYY